MPFHQRKMCRNNENLKWFYLKKNDKYFVKVLERLLHLGYIMNKM